MTAQYRIGAALGLYIQAHEELHLIEYHQGEVDQQRRDQCELRAIRAMAEFEDAIAALEDTVGTRVDELRDRLAE